MASSCGRFSLVIFQWISNITSRACTDVSHNMAMDKRRFNDQVWVTSVISDDEVSQALIFRHSLRRVFTTRKVAVIVSSTVNVKLRKVLEQEFDMMFFLDTDHNTAGLKLSNFAKLYALIALRSFGTCAYASPTMLALQNCDKIFTDTTESFLLSRNSLDTSIFLFKPSLLHFDSLMTGLSSVKQLLDSGTSFDAYFYAWTKNQNGKVEYIQDKFNCLIEIGKPIVRYEQDISMANLKEFYEGDDMSKLENTGVLGKLIAVHWQKIKEKDVLPKLQQSPTLHPTVSTDLPDWKKEPIAVVGMSCRYPSSNSPEEFWDLLLKGQDGTGRPPAHKWLREHIVGKTDGKATNAGFLKDAVDKFDSKFFGISPKEAEFLDPQHRIIHELVWEGLEDAGIDPHSLRGTTGSVFLGSWLNDYKDVLKASAIYQFFRAYMGTSIGAATARISFLLGITGPSIATESGCSSSSVAVHLACKSLLHGETNLALACGVNLLLHPFDKDEMQMVLSPDGHCRTFSEDANGFARAEGAGVLVLKRLSDAIKDGDHIWGLIRGSALSQEGLSKSMGTPTVHSESLAMQETLNNAQVAPEEVSYVEAHGTGTAVGDPMEVAAIAKSYYSPKRQEPLVIGSVKTNVGHTESCSGITGIMKVILAMQHEIIPAHLNFSKLNPAIDLDAIPGKIPLEQMEWKKCLGKPRIAGVSSFGITGTDTHVILEEAPTLNIPKALSVVSKVGLRDRPLHIIKVSAKTEEAFSILLGKYREALPTCGHSLADIAYTTNTGRADFGIRAAMVASSNDNLCAKIEQQDFLKAEVNPDSLGKICFLFTGQGSQYPNMAKQLYDTSPVFRIHFDHCEAILRHKYKISIKDVLWSKGATVQELSRTIYNNTSIFCVEYALLKLWESFGVKPDFVLGHSLGEFAAVVCTGILSVEDAIMLVAERSLLVDRLPGGKMLVIKSDQQNVDKAMKKFSNGDNQKLLDYAAVNSNQQTVVAGDAETILEFSNYCKDNNIKCIILDASHAFHSKHMDPILSQYKQLATTAVNLGAQGNCEYISGVTGGLLDSREVNADYWVRHTRDKVSFLKASKKAIDLGCKIFIEIGPKPVLSALTRMNNDGNFQCLPSLKQNENEWLTLLETLGKLYVSGYKIDWAGLDQYQSRKKVRLPHYPFVRKPFWPEMTQTTGGTIHPLIGAVIQNASATKLFQGGLNLRSHEYIKDHAIGQTAVFPGAGYLEMCLAAGLAAIQGSIDTLAKPTRPMKVENLGIQAPLAIEESRTCKIQTVVDFNTVESNRNDWNDVTVRILRHLETDISSSWVSHATATFSPLPTAQEQLVSFDTERFLKTLSSPSDPEAISKVYDKLAGVGLKFGPMFRSLHRLWKDEKENSILTQLNVPPVLDNQSVQYIIHPAVIDAMFQAIMVLKLTSKMKKKLFVPIKVGKFVWLSEGTNDSDERYIYVRDGNVNADQSSDDLSTTNTTALLLDRNGKVLAVMSGAEFIGTTVKTVESILEQQITTMPDLWEEIWYAKPGPMQHMHDNVECNKSKFYTNEFVCEMADKYDVTTAEQNEINLGLEKLTYYNVLRCLYKCGFQPDLNYVYTEENLVSQLKINEKFTKMFGFYLHILAEEGILKRDVDPGTWKLVSLPPPLEVLEEWLTSSSVTVELVNKFRSTLLFTTVGNNLSSIIQGKISALGIIFPAENLDQDNSSVSEFYTDYGNFSKARAMGTEICTSFHQYCASHAKGLRNIYRICEIGAGTGAFTRAYLNFLETSGIEFEYTYTDISAAFFPAAATEFEKHRKYVSFRKLNIEEDPISQGFIPEYYDLVLASDVIHATRNIKESLSHVKMLLKQGGKFQMLEMTRISRVITYLFGLLEGFWRFEDFDVRSSHCTLSTQKWRQVLEESGYEWMTSFPCMNHGHSYICAQRKFVYGRLSIVPSTLAAATSDKIWILFHQPEHATSEFLKEKLVTLPYRKVVVVTQDSMFRQINRETYIEFTARPESEVDFVNIFEYVKRLKNVVLEGVLYCWSLKVPSRCQTKILKPYFYVAKSLPAFKQSVPIKFIAVTNGASYLEDTDISQYDTSTISSFTKTLENERIELNCRCVDMGGDETDSGKWQIFYELWNTDRSMQVAYKGLSRYVPKLNSFKPALSDLKLPVGSDRFQLILPPSRSIADLDFGVLKSILLQEEEVEIQVKASSLNFRDVLSVLKPSEYFNDSNAVGFDFAGVVKRIGPGLSKWSVGDRVYGINSARTALPSHIRQHEDDVLPVPDDMTFCEASTLPAVVTTSFLCLMDVAKITSSDTVLIHTASGGVGLSAIEICKHVGATVIATAGSKRKQSYLRSLGVAQVFHSRTTDYADEIMRVTNGRGVDVVLNSLTGEGFKEATLRACALGARFVEMSKLSIWEPEEVQQRRPDVQYTKVDLTLLSDKEIRRLLRKMVELVEKKIVSPVPYVRFDGVHIREALQYLQKAKHIGKVSCILPEIRHNEGKTEVYTAMFHENATYLITGGLGGIGFTVCQWMVKRGARYVILAGRNPPNSTIQQAITQLNAKYNAKVLTVQLDISQYTECEQLFKVKLVDMGYPILRGIMHAAGTLADGLIQNQTWDNLSSTFQTKITGTMNLHELTKTNSRMEHFVMFSSMAALFGTPGQCNHSAGNTFEDAFALYRNSIGLPATSINWGQWGEVGIATEVDIPGIKPFSNLQALKGLEYAMKSQRTQTAIMSVDSFVLMSKILPGISYYVNERLWKASSLASVAISISSDVFWKQYDAAENADAKLKIVKVHARFIIKKILRLDEADEVDDNGDFQEMGIDSLMFVEIRNAVQALLGDRVIVNASAMRDSNTLELLSNALLNVIEGMDVVDEAAPTMEEVNNLIKEDCVLPEHIRQKEGQVTIPIDKVSRVLITGCTGTLGPYVLKEVCNMSQITDVYCLVRVKGKKVKVEERLKKILEERELLADIDMKKVRYVTGNVALPQLGLQNNIDWDELCDKVEAVIHCSANVHHTEYYRKRNNNADMRAVNNGGLINILEFASTGSKLKHVYLASSFAGVATTDKEGNFSEEWPEAEDYLGATLLSYPITKFVGDVLMKEAVLERGIPGKVFRFPLILGDSKTGRFVLDRNHLMLRYFFILKNGIMPDIPFPMAMLPVDTCAKVTLQLFFNPSVPDDMYNVMHREPDVDQEFTRVAEKFGYNVDFVEFSKFTEKLRDSTSDDSPFALFRKMYAEKSDLEKHYTTYTSLRSWVIDGGTRDFFTSKKLRKYAPDFFSDPFTEMEHLHRDLEFAKSQGWLDKYCK